MARLSRTGVFTLRPRTREEPGCWCPFPPGCSGSPCVAGPRWKIRALVRQRHEWATASATAVISEERRAAELGRIAALLTVTRRSLRPTAGWEYDPRRDAHTAPITTN